MQLRVPPLGESITEATISRWLKREGDAVNAGETLVELETDKITVEVPALKGGVLTTRARAEGDVVKVGEVLGEFDESAAGSAVPAAIGAAPSTISHPSSVISHPSSAIADVRAAPSAVRLAAESGTDLSQVAGTGRGGVISKPDVMAAMSAPAPAPVAAAAAIGLSPTAIARPVGERETREKMTTRRKRIAENLLQAQHATAHLTTFNEIDLSAIMALRDRMKEKVEKEHGVKLSFMPFFARAACLALRAFPTVNAQIDGETIIFKHYVNLGIAVASEGGLVVPNVKDADRKGTLDTARAIMALATKARDGKLTMDDLTGGSFTITNGGVFGSLLSTPIINYPQVAILGLHKTQDRPVAVNGQVVIRPMMYVALSYDHRIVDGQQAVLFLVKLKELMEDPATMLID
ncbi:MAG: 2-oxoglutarate dehydrogenase complex dihydrolipoyllysine-residue succinyltransferase [Gemmatimonadota bacterium]